MFGSILSLETIETWKIIVLLLSSLGLGFVFSVVYALLKKEQGYSREYTITLVIYPFVATALMLIAFYLTGVLSASDTDAKLLRAGVAVASIFTMTRWRSAPRSSEELTYLFFMTALGTALGLGFVGYAVIIVALLIVVLVVLKFINFPFVSRNQYSLKVTIPEDIDYETCFVDTFKKYTNKVFLKKIRTSDLGTMFTLSYTIELKNGVSQKELIDELRAINGNLNIQMNSKRFDYIEE